MSVASRAYKLLSRAYRSILRSCWISNHTVTLSLPTRMAAPSARAEAARATGQMETLEPRLMLSGTHYVDQFAFADVTNDVDGSGTLTAGDEVTWDSGAGEVQTGLVYGTDAFSQIQSAIDFVGGDGDADAVKIAAGDYTQSLTVDKSLDLVGAGADLVTIDTSFGVYTITTDAPQVSISGLSIENNTAGGVIVNSGTTDLFQVDISAPRIGVQVGSAHANIEESVLRITDSGAAIAGVVVTSTGTASVNGSDLSDRAAGVAVFNDSSINTVDASGNWFGSSDEATVAASVSGLVDITPFLTSGADLDTATSGFQGDASDLVVTTLGQQTGSDGRIQEAVDLVTESGVVTLADGMYVESNAVIGKSLTLQGNASDRSAVTIVPAAEDDHTAAADFDGQTDSFDGTYQIGLIVRSDDVTVQNLTIDGDANTALTGDHNFRTAIVVDNTGGTDWDHFVADNLVVTSAYYRGIELNPVYTKGVYNTAPATGHVISNSLISDVSFWEGVFSSSEARFENNTITDVQGAGWLGAGLRSYAASEYLNNTISDVMYGIVADTDATIIGNDISSVPTGIIMNNHLYGEHGSATVIQGNSITNMLGSGSGMPGLAMSLVNLAGGSIVGGSGAGEANVIDLTGVTDGAGMYLWWNPDGDVTIEGNDIELGGANVGIALGHNEVAATPMQVLDNTITDTTGLGTGLLVTDDFDNGDDYTNLAGNSFSGMDTAIELEADAGSGHIIETTFGAGNTIDNVTTGVRITGEAAAAGDTLGDVEMTNVSGQYVELTDGAYAGGELDATGVSLDGLTGASATLDENFAIEDKVTHGTDDDTLGLVRVKAGEVFVTPDSGSIQRGVGVAADGDTIHVDAGVYEIDSHTTSANGNRGGIVIDKSVNLLGAGSAADDPASSSIITLDAAMTDSLYAVYVDGLNQLVDGVTISGFRFDGEPGGSGVNGLLRGVMAEGNSIDAGWESVGVRNLTVSNNVFADMGRGVVVRGNAENVTVDSNLFTGIDSYVAIGMSTGYWPSGSSLAWSMSGIDVTNNTITNSTALPIRISNYRMSYGATIDDVQIVGNTISDIGTPVYPDSYAGAIMSWCDMSNLVIADNTITSIQDMHGISLSAYDYGDPGYTGGYAGLVITGNVIEGVTGSATTVAGATDAAALMMQNGYGNGYFADGYVVSDNSFDAGSANPNVYWDLGAGVTTALDASGNWWGSTDEATVAGGIAGSGAAYVDFTPYLGSGTDTDPGAVGFQGDFSTLYVTDEGAQAGPAGRIGEAIDRVTTGGTVNVNDGTYSEGVVIDKSVSLIGDAGDAAAGPGANAPVIDPAGSTHGVYITASDVTVEGFTVSNARYNGIILGYGDQPTDEYQNVKIRENLVNPVTGGHGFGIYAGYQSEALPGGTGDDRLTGLLDFSGLEITGNEIVDANGAALVVQSVTTSGGDLLVQGNYIHGGAQSGVWIDSAEHVDVTGNTLTGNANGVFISGYADGYYEGTAGGSYDPRYIDITGNTITGNADSGIKVYDGFIADIHINQNEIAANGSWGVYNFIPAGDVLDATYNDWGTADVSAIEAMLSTPSNIDYTPYLDTDTDRIVVDDDWSSLADGTQVVLGDVVYEIGLNAFDTVGEGVLAVSSGGEVLVLSGSYTTAGQIVIDKDVALTGENRATTTLGLSFDTGSSGDSRGWFLVESGVTFDVSGVTLDGSGQLVYQAIRQKGSGSVSDVAFENILFNESGPTYSGVAIAAFGDGALDVTDSTFDNIGRIGVLYYGAGVAGSVFSGNTYTGKGAGDWLDYALDISAGATVDVFDNTITNNYGVASSDGSTSAGIIVSTYFGGGTAAEIHSNFITGNSTGVYVGYNETDTSDVTIFENDLSGNDTAIVSTAPQVDASGNWFGTTDEATVIGMIAGDVDITPFLASGDADAATAGFQGDFSTLHVTDEGSQTGTTGRIQEAIDRVDGSTVHVNDGTYAERLNLNKQVNLLGAQAGVDARGRTGQETIITESGLSTPNPDVLIEVGSAGAGSTIDGFTLEGDPTNTTADTSVLRIWADDITVANNIISGTYGVVYKGGDGLVVDQNAMAINKGGIVAQPGASTNTQVTDNVIGLGTSPQADMSGIYMTAIDGVVISGNELDGFVTRAIGGSGWTNATISSNVLTNNKDGVSIWGDSSFIDISGNTISDSSRYGINIKAADLEISGNAFDGNTEAAVSIDTHGNVTERVTVSGNSYTNTTTGVLVHSGDVDVDESIDGATVAAVQVDGGTVGIAGQLTNGNRGVWVTGGDASIGGANIAGNRDGIHVAGGSVSVAASTISDNTHHGLILFGGGDVEISDTTFSGNATGQPTGSGYGEVTLYDFTGDATLTNVDIVVDDADYGLQIRGTRIGGGDETPTAAAGNIALTDVSITGDAVRYGMVLQTYLDASSLSFSNVEIDANATYGLAMWDVLGSEIDLGTTTFASTHDYDLVASLADIDATGATFLDGDLTTGVALDQSILANNFAIEDRVGHGIDYIDPTYGAGLVTWNAGHLYVTPNSWAPTLNTEADIQRAIELSADGDTIHVAAGTYDNTLEIEGRTDLSIVGEDRDTVILVPTSTLDWNVGGYGSGRQTVVRIVDSSGISLSGMTTDMDSAKGGFVFAGLGWDSEFSVDDTVWKNNAIVDTEPGGYYDLGWYVLGEGFTDTDRGVVTFTGSEFTDMGRVGIVLHDFLDATVSGNTFTKSTADFGYGVELGSQAIGEITGNIFSGFNTYAASDGSASGGIYVENAFTNVQVSPITKTVLIDDNEVSDSTYGIIVGHTYSSLSGPVAIEATVTNNTLTDNEYGVHVADSAAGSGSSVTVTMSGNTITGSTAAGVGASAGDGDISVSIDGDEITAGSTGILAETDDIEISVANADLTGNDVGVAVSGGATVDLGGGTLGSVGNNDLSGYTGGAGNYAVENLNTAADSQPDVAAENNNWGPIASASAIEGVVYDDTDDPALTQVIYTNPQNLSTTPSATVYVDDDWAGAYAFGDTFDHDADAGTADLTWGQDAFAVIQDGVNAVADGGQVYVLAGTYTANGQTLAIIDKALTLTGSGQGDDDTVDTILAGGSYGAGQDTTGVGIAWPRAILIQSDNVTIEGLRIRDFMGDQVNVGGYGIVARAQDSWGVSDLTLDSITVQDVTFHDVTYGVRGQDTTGLTVQDTTFGLTTYTPLDGGYAFYLSGTAAQGSSGTIVRDNVVDGSSIWVTATTDALIEGNTVTDANYNGIWLGQQSAAGTSSSGTVRGNVVSGTQEGGIVIWNRDNESVGAISVTDNVVTNAGNPGWNPNGGIAVYSVDSTSLEILRNEVSGTGSTGLNVMNSTLDDVTIEGNSFTGSAMQGALFTNVDFADVVFTNNVLEDGLVISGGTGDLQAGGNWWGSNDEADVKAAANGGVRVDYTPWLDASTDTDGGAVGFAGDFSMLHVDDDSLQLGTSGRIQEAIDRVTNSTVYVHAGTYAESITIDKALQLLGDGSGSTILDASGLNGAISITSSDVTVDGFEIVGDGSTKYGVYVNGGDAGLDSIAITNNDIHGMSLANSTATPGSPDVYMSYGILSDSKGGSQWGRLTNLTITGNSIHDIGDGVTSGGYGLNLYDVDGATISGNAFANLATSSDLEGTAVSVSYAGVGSSSNPLNGIAGVSQNVSISGNTYDGLANGISLISDASSSVTEDVADFTNVTRMVANGGDDSSLATVSLIGQYAVTNDLVLPLLQQQWLDYANHDATDGYYDTIQGAIDNSASGATVDVTAGNFNEAVTISQSLTLQGAGAGVTTIDGTGLENQNGVRLNNVDGNVTVDGFTIEGAFNSSTNRAYQVVIAGGTAGSTFTVSNNEINAVGSVAANADYGVIAQNGEATVNVTGNTISDANWHGVMYEKWAGATETSFNTFNVYAGDPWATATLHMNYAHNGQSGNVTTLQSVHDNVINGQGGSGVVLISGLPYGYNSGSDGVFSSVLIADNVMTDIGGKGVQLEADSDTSGFQNVTIRDNDISAAASSSTTMRGVRLLAGLVNANVSIEDNTITGFDQGVYQGGSFGQPVYASGTVIDGNTFDDNTVAVNVDGGQAMFQGNELAGNTIGLLVSGGAIVDAGGGTLGSTGGNDFRGYVASTDAEGAIVVGSDDGGLVGPQGQPADIAAKGNIFTAPVEDVIYHDADDNNLAFVDYADLAGLSIADLSATPIDEGDSVTLTGSFTNDPQAHTVEIAWGDGLTDTIDLVQGDFDFSITHTYADDDPDTGTASDVLPISVTVTEAIVGGASATASTSVTVNNTAPTVAILGAPATSPEGTQIDLTADVSDLGTDTLTYAWTVTKDGDPYASGVADALSFTPDDNGTYEVTLTVTDDDTGQTTVTETIAVTNVTPGNLGLTVDASVDENGVVTLDGSFTDPGDADTHTVTVVWNDGDSSTISLTGGERTFSTTHQYLDDGVSGTASDVYSIDVTVADDDTDQTVASTSTTVSNVDPVLSNVQLDSYAIDEGDAVTLTGDLSDVGTLDTFTLVIDWGDGHVTTDTPTAGAFSYTHTYADDDPTGTSGDDYTVTVTVTDDDTGSDVDSKVVSVANVTPTVSIDGAPASSPEGTPITLNSTVTDPGTDTFSYAWQVLKDSVLYQTGSDPSLTFTPDDNASYEVTLAVTDDDTDVASDTVTITVTDVTPTIDLAGDAEVDEGSAYSLTLDNLVDPGDDPVDLVRVLWGDSTTSTVFDPSTHPLPQTVTHVYDDGPASRTISVEVISEGNSYVAGSKIVQVNNVAPTAMPLTGGAVNEGEDGLVELLLADDASSADEAAGFTYSYDFNQDGDFADAGEAAGVAASSRVIPGSYLSDDPSQDVDVYIHDKDGGTTKYTATITVNNVAPVVDAGADMMAFASQAFTKAVSFTDPGDDADWTVSVDWDGDSVVDETFTTPSRSFDLTHTYSPSTTPANYTVTVTVDDGDTGIASDSFDVTVVENTFRVTGFQQNASGFDVTFNRSADLDILNLYDGRDASVDLPDLSLVRNGSETIAGSMVWDAASNTLAFVKTGGVLEDGSYQLTLSSRSNGFADTAGALLDGDTDYVAGGDYVTSFSVANGAARAVYLPDFARGAGQDVDIPATGQYLPLRLDNATGVTAIDVDIVCDPSLLVLNNAIKASGLPADWTVTQNLIPGGRLKLTLSGTTPLSGSDVDLVRINASVPSTAEYGDSQAIRLENLRINEDLIPSVADSAIHKAMYLGDADGDAIYTGYDAALISRTVVNLDSGFDASDWTDPLIVGDTTGDGTLSGQDASLTAQKAALMSVPQIPDLPGIVVTPITSGVDPELSIPDAIIAAPGSEVTVPLNITVEAGAEVISATADVFYDSTVLSIEASDVTLGSFWSTDWSLTANVVEAGHLRLVFYAVDGQSPTGTGEIAQMTFTVDAGAPEGLTTLNVEPVAGNDGLTWTEDDGSVDVAAPGDANLDGKVSFLEAARAVAQIGKTPATWADGDIDNDGIVEVSDADEVVASYVAGQTPPPSAASLEDTPMAPLSATVVAPSVETTAEADLTTGVDEPAGRQIRKRDRISDSAMGPHADGSTIRTRARSDAESYLQTALDRAAAGTQQRMMGVSSSTMTTGRMISPAVSELLSELDENQLVVNLLDELL